MKRILSVVIAIMLGAVSLTACGDDASANKASEAPKEKAVQESEAQTDTTQTSENTQVTEPEADSEPASTEEAGLQSDDNGFRVVTDSDTEVFYSADDPSVLGNLGTYCMEGGLGNKTVTVTGKLEYLLPDPDGGVLVFWDSENTVFCPAPVAAKSIYDQYGDLQNCICTIKITFSDTPISYTYYDGNYQQVDGLSYATNVEIVSYKQL